MRRYCLIPFSFLVFFFSVFVNIDNKGELAFKGLIEKRNENVDKHWDVS